MPSLKSIKKRIASVKSTQKITKAMKMVAAAKLRRAQQAVTGARHYTQDIIALSDRLALSQGWERHPFTVSHEKIAKRDYLVFTSDRGLCGGFNSNLLRKLGDLLLGTEENKIRTDCRIVGKKGRDYFKSKGWELAEAVTGIYEKLDRGISEELAKIAIHRFEGDKADEVWIAYNYFKSTMMQVVTFKKILPLEFSNKGEGTGANTIYEPNQKEILDQIFKERIVSQIHQAFLESITSELASRMAAMDNATNNASDMIGYLTLQYNRARQAAITRELMDIVNGAEALR